ncbi:PadR family transcriptional regulator [Anaerobacterium chartisolvens]|uniref:PadR family transcriptional regulator n=1 Tax=Anaerobacterium chartisolvens TaxID=1297424 RepID=A0A369BBP4_9FIRM|nr:helix-turn-helix transcriptional regulator [Anaerobacterium chartisolvens]RCX18831.1 PadR family transcriptional regulator [Anaerobacterium chartisolvens]
MSIDKLKKRFIPMSETMFYILSSLNEERHGYGIMQYVQKLTNGRIILGAGTIYQSISKLEQDGLIIPTKEYERKKEYIITDSGREILRLEAVRICELYLIAKELV